MCLRKHVKKTFKIFIVTPTSSPKCKLEQLCFAASHHLRMNVNESKSSYNEQV